MNPASEMRNLFIMRVRHEVSGAVLFKITGGLNDLARKVSKCVVRGAVQHSLLVVKEYRVLVLWYKV